MRRVGGLHSMQCRRCRSSLSAGQPQFTCSAIQVLYPQALVPWPLDIGVLMQLDASGWLRRPHAQPCHTWQATRQPTRSSRTRAPVSRTQLPACRAARKVRTRTHDCMHAYLRACTRQRQLHSMLSSYVLCAVLLAQPPVPICACVFDSTQQHRCSVRRSLAVKRALAAHIVSMHVMHACDRSSPPCRSATVRGGDGRWPQFVRHLYPSACRRRRTGRERGGEPLRDRELRRDRVG